MKLNRGSAATVIDVEINKTTPWKIEMEIQEIMLIVVALESANVGRHALLARRPLTADGDNSLRRS